MSNKTTLVQLNSSKVSEYIDDILMALDKKSLTPHEAYAVVCMAKLAMEKTLGITDSGIVGYENTK